MTTGNKRPRVRGTPWGRNVSKSVRHLEVKARILLDLLRTRRQLRSLQKGFPSTDVSHKPVLILALSDSIYETKLLMMLALALRRRRKQIKILLPSRTSRLAAYYWKALGMTEFVYLDGEDLNDDEIAALNQKVGSFLGSDLTFSKVKAWTFAGSWIGPQILSTVSRMRFMGAPDPRDPATAAEIRSLLPVVLERVKRAERVLDQVDPGVCLVVEANYALFGPFVDKAIERGSDVIQSTQPWRDDALICKRLNKETRRMSPSSVDPMTLERLKSRPWTAREEQELDRVFRDRYGGSWFLQRRNQPGTTYKSREQIADELQLDPALPIAVVFSHILWDANLFYGEDLFDDYGHWFVETVKAANRNDRVSWVVKLHPSNLWKRAYEQVQGEYAEVVLLNDHVGPLPSHVHLLYPGTEISSLSLFDHAEYGITVRGTSGMEMACFGKPVFTAGTGRYSGLGFTIDSTTREDYLGKLDLIEEFPPLNPEQTLLARRHAHAALHLRPWKMLSFRSQFAYKKQGADPLDHNLFPVAKTHAEISQNGDLDDWAKWVENRSLVDYIALS